MRPVRLRMRNFLSYADETFDFNFTLGVLIGATGSGKSSLLDAVTWAIWGRARTSPKGLSRYGQTPTEVDLLFEADSRVYAVSRKWTTGGSLQFSVQKEDGWSPLTGRTLKETQEAIESVVRVSYETFTCSSFLQQGRADAFLQKGPAERKKVLEDILSLGDYETWSSIARSKATNADAQASALLTSAEALSGQLLEENAEEALPQLRSELAAVEEKIQVGEPKLQALQERVIELRSNRKQTSPLRDRLADISESVSKLKTKRERLSDLSVCPVCCSTIEHDRKSSLLSELDAELRNLTEKETALREELTRQTAENEKLDSELLEAQATVSRVSPALALLKTEATNLQSKITQLQTIESMNEKLRAEITERKTKADSWRLLAEDYRLIAEACGRTGVPSRIIKTAIPELESSANEFLSLLTEGELQVSFKTGTESGRETLEVEVLDGVYTRPYETYSGGQSFRISLAIRLGLSLLLARSANVPVRLLVVDEGFGSNDLEGRQLIVECIKKVSSHFDVVLVITHMDDLKVAFPIRFEVSREPSGSRIERI